MREQNANDYQLGWLSEWHVLVAICSRCRHRRRLSIDAIMRRYPRIGLVQQIAPMLACRQCGNREGNQVEIGRLPRNL